MVRCVGFGILVKRVGHMKDARFKDFRKMEGLSAIVTTSRILQC